MINFKFYKNIEYLFLFIAFFSILNNGVLVFFGIRLYLIIAICGLLFYRMTLTNYNNIITYELIYFFFLYLIIKLFFSYNDINYNSRSILQGFDGRYLSQLFRFFLEITASSYFYCLFKKNRDLFLKVLLLSINATILIALVDFIFLGRTIYTQLVGDTHVTYRLTGLNIEPRMFGLILVYVYTFLKLFNFTDKKLFLIILSIFFTISVSSIFLFLFVYAYFNKKNVFIISLALVFISIIIFFIIIPNAESFSLLYERLIQLSTFNGENDYFSFFSIFEVFDRAALNALFNNKIYLMIGFGPNTISIPSSDYIDDKYYKTYDGIINAVPHIGLINMISRSGLLFFIYFYYKLIKRKNKIFLIIYLIQYNFIFYSFYQILFPNNNDKKD